jgi:DNA-binding beta-propeller fold protein YncE
MGEGDGQFRELTSVTSSASKIYVADARNARIQVFTPDGHFVKKVEIPEWREPAVGWRSPHVFFDRNSNVLYASCSGTNDIIVFDPDVNRLERRTGDATKQLSGPTGLTVQGDKMFVINTLGSSVTVVDAYKKHN